MALKKYCDAQELVDLMKSGDIEALDRTTRCYGERLLSVGRKICRNSEDAQDAVQDALLSAGENLESFRGDGSVEGWLSRMVVNACHRMRRGRKNDPNLHTTEQEIPSEETPEQNAHRGEISSVLGEAMLSLTPEDRLIFLLAEGEDWTGPEIGIKLGMSSGAVRTRLTRIRKKMRDQIEERVSI